MSIASFMQRGNLHFSMLGIIFVTTWAILAIFHRFFFSTAGRRFRRIPTNSFFRILAFTVGLTNRTEPYSSQIWQHVEFFAKNGSIGGTIRRSSCHRSFSATRYSCESIIDSDVFFSIFTDLLIIRDHHELFAIFYVAHLVSGLGKSVLWSVWLRRYGRLIVKKRRWFVF